MKTTIILGFTCGIIGLLCLGCGPQPEPAESTPAIDASQQGLCSSGGHGICQGWNGSGRQRCLANCNNTTYWMDSGAAYYFSGLDACTYVDYGQCAAAAQNFCWAHGWAYQGACWGIRG